MKIVCDNCATKYSIADEKVRGKVFKIRCKKCSHIIVVRGNEGGQAEAADTGGEAMAGEESSLPPGGQGEGGSDAVWHLVIDREQVGPMTAAEVRAKVAAGQCDVETYAWREGFGDWLRLGSIDDFRDLATGAAKAASEASTMIGAEMPEAVAALARGAAAGQEAARGSDANDIFNPAGAPSAGDNGADLFGNAGATQAAPPSAVLAASAGEDLFGSAAASPAPAAAPANLFAAMPSGPAPRERSNSPGFGTPAVDAAAPIAEPPVDSGPQGPKMTGQRNESSVLFSLNNLQALATGGAANSGAMRTDSSGDRPGYANSKTEGSGLIDIRAMAAQTLSAAPGPSSAQSADLPVLSAAPVFSPVVAAPIMMPTQPQGMPKWVWAIVGGGGLAVVAVVVLLVVVMTKKQAEPPVLAMNTVPAAVVDRAPAATAPAVAAPAAPAPAPAAAPAAEAAKPAAPAAAEKGDAKAVEKGGHHDSKAAPASSKHDSKGATGGKKEEGGAAPVAAKPALAAAPAPAKAEKPAAKKGGGDELDSLLDTATGGKGDAPKRAAAPARAAADDSNCAETLGRGDIVSSMQAIKGTTKKCFAQFHVNGMVNMNVTVVKTGKVAAANAVGTFAGTPTGDCVAKAVRTASFKCFKQDKASFTWPVLLP